ncbi:MAG: ABC transporter ATP-binding protein/permease [Clostridia bacterium]|nr:ABC transporter ATP-binding protein/permease [Clostridia bacterium]
MLETRELLKIYKPKKGVPVTALNKVSLKFPETGMVFLLGKSGSGKSTLLNLLGGLDSYNGGEIIIKGVSSKSFKQKHFDSYRNTYVGFIFQEYNVLDDFTVGANIALAIELQNRKATDDEVNKILEEVDLAGYGARKPNELSGGQKQRVAIARALVKKPQIIMADEPTGALDSVTGKQVFDTLKKLSKEKLVIVVSHDREFAENYADRIIELADGSVISDMEINTDADFSEAETRTITYNQNVIELPCGYHITEQDRIAINEYIDSIKNGTVKLQVNTTASSCFVKTDVSKIKTQDGSAFKLIKSKLPLKNAFKIGTSSLKYKKFRLCITILLSCVAFALFGLSDTFGAYNHIKTCTNSLADSELSYVSTAKSKKVGEGINSYWRDYGYSLSDKDLNALKENTGVVMHGVYVPLDSDLSFGQYIDPQVSLSETDFDIYNTLFTGFAEISNSVMEDMHFELLAGTLPDGAKNEIAVSEYVFEIFKKAKYTDITLPLKENEKPKYEEIKSYNDLIGKTLLIDGVKYTVTAIVDTDFNIERYVSLTEEKEYQSEADRLVDYILFSEFDFSAQYSYACVIMTGEGFVDKMISERPKISNITEGYIGFGGKNYNVDTNYMARLGDIDKKLITWVDGEKTTLGEYEIIATTDSVYEYFDEESATQLPTLEDGSIDYVTMIKNSGDLDVWGHKFDDNEVLSNTNKYKLVGIINNTSSIQSQNMNIRSTLVCSDKMYNEFTEGPDCYYSFSVGEMPKEKSDIKTLVSYCYREDSSLRYQIQNSVTYELDAINSALQEVSKIFLYIGLGFAAFAALMLANFIGTSISYKKQEIGILRAIGSRGNDVFRIFFAESFVIAMINFVLSALGVGIITAVINHIVRTRLGVLITVLSFGPRQIILLLAVSIAVAFIASFIPVKRIASKRPIDAIRNR